MKRISVKFIISFSIAVFLSQSVWGKPSNRVKAPSMLMVVAASPESITLQWRFKGPPDSKFAIERSSISLGSDFSDLKIVKSVSRKYSDSEVRAGEIYYYRVSSLDKHGTRRESQSIEAWAGTGLLTPTSFKARWHRTHSISLEWLDRSESEEHYIIERSEVSPDFGFISILTLSRNVTAYRDVTPIEGRRYYYRVRAVNPAGAVSSLPVLVEENADVQSEQDSDEFQDETQETCEGMPFFPVLSASGKFAHISEFGF